MFRYFTVVIKTKGFEGVLCAAGALPIKKKEMGIYKRKKADLKLASFLGRDLVFFFFLLGRDLVFFLFLFSFFLNLTFFLVEACSFFFS